MASVTGRNEDGSISVDQMSLVICLMRHVEKEHGRDVSLTQRQSNSLIEAANVIVSAFARPVVRASPGMGMAAWLACDDVGASSRYMAAVISGSCAVSFVKREYPRDPSDLWRCVMMLDAIPELRSKLSVMADPIHGPEWNAIARNWSELESLCREEWPTGKAPKCYAAMKAIIDGATNV